MKITPIKKKNKKKKEKKSSQGSYLDTHQRVTTYIRKVIRQKMEILKEEDLIDSYASLVNKALEHYIKEHL